MRKFGRKKDNRESMLKNLTTSVILYEKITTTEAKAKETRSMVEKAINIGKKGTLDSRRKLLEIFSDKNAVKKIFEVLAPRYKKITGGYVKIYKNGNRLGDGAPKVIVKLSGTELEKNDKNDTKSKEHENHDTEKKTVTKNNKITTTVKEKSSRKTKEK